MKVKLTVELNTFQVRALWYAIYKAEALGEDADTRPSVRDIEGLKTALNAAKVAAADSEEN